MIDITETKETLTNMISEHKDFTWEEIRAIYDAVSILGNEEWIPVTEYLPSRNGNYQVTVESTDRGRRAQRVSSFYRANIDDDGDWGIQHTPNWIVKAWKPLNSYYTGD